MVVEEDELRVSAGDVLHHQVVAEEVAESQGLSCAVKRRICKQHKLSVEGYYRGMSCTTKALTCRQEDRIHALFFTLESFCKSYSAKSCTKFT